MSSKIEVLICTYNYSLGRLLKKLPEPSKRVSFLISHQVSEDVELAFFVEQIESIAHRSDVRIKSIRGSGLSKNRNNALKHATGEIILIADDDVEFAESWASNIIEVFDQNKQADLITFRIKTPEGDFFKNYYPDSTVHTRRTLFRVASIEVAARRQAVKESGVIFDTSFGLNSKFNSCEETVFLCDLLKKGLVIINSEKVIAIHPRESSGSNYEKSDSCIAKGAVIRRVFGIFGLPLVFAFAMKHHREYVANHSFLRFCRLAINGFNKAG